MALDIANAAHEPAIYTINGKRYAIALFTLFDSHPDKVTPVFMRDEGGVFTEFARYDTLWRDITDDNKPEDVGAWIVTRFNTELQKLGAPSLTWEEELAIFFRTRVQVVNGILAVV